MAHTLAGRKDPLYAAVYSPDGRWLAAVGGDRRLRVWRVADYGLVREERLASDALYAVAFAPDQQRLIVGGGDARGYLIPFAPPRQE